MLSAITLGRKMELINSQISWEELTSIRKQVLIFDQKMEITIRQRFAVIHRTLEQKRAIMPDSVNGIKFKQMCMKLADAS